MSASPEPFETAAAQAPDAPPLGLGDVIRYLRRAAPSILAGAALALAGAGLYVATTPRSFTALAQVFVDPASAQLFTQDAARLGDAGTVAARIDSQAEVMKSGGVAQAVIRSLALTEDQEFQPGAPPWRGVLRALLRSVASPAAATIDPTPAEPEPSGSEEHRARLDRIALVRTEMEFRRRLSVRRIGQSLVFEISFSSAEPEKAARIANAVAEAYVSEIVRARSAAARQGGDWLEERIEDLRDRSFEALGNVERFRSVGGAGSVNDSSVRLAELESISQSIRRVYEMYLERFNETIQRVSYPLGEARVVSVANPPVQHSHPRSMLILAFAGVLGAGSGAAAPLLARSLGRSIRSRRSLVDRTGVACLGTVAPGRFDRRRRWLGRRGRRAALTPQALQPGSEAQLRDLRAVKVSIDRMLDGAAPRSIGVTSARDGDGKTTLAARLAHVCAMAGERTLLVDGSTTSPALGDALAPGQVDGLMDAIAEPARLPGLMLPGPLPHLSILTAGRASILAGGRAGNGATAGDLLGAANAALRLAELRRGFDTVVIDLPSLDAGPDARALGAQLDGLVLVARHDASMMAEVAEAVAVLRGDGASVLGIVVAGLDARRRPEWLR